ncbi:MAG: hypothetical protein V1859_01460 [archaeon]
MDVQELIGKFSGKKQEENGSVPVKELIKFKEGILDKYPSADIKLTVYPSSFGIHIIADNKEKKEKAVLMEGSLTIFSDEENLKCLLSQLEAAEKKKQSLKNIKESTTSQGLLQCTGLKIWMMNLSKTF